MDTLDAQADALGVPRSSVIYGGAYHGNTLHSINTSTGALTAIGTGNIGGNYLLFGSTSWGLYGIGWDDVLYSIDPATGAATEIGATGLPIGGVMGMSAGGNTLYVTTNNSLYAVTVLLRLRLALARW